MNYKERFGYGKNMYVCADYHASAMTVREEARSLTIDMGIRDTVTHDSILTFLDHHTATMGTTDVAEFRVKIAETSAHVSWPILGYDVIVLADMINQLVEESYFVASKIQLAETAGREAFKKLSAGASV